MLEDKSHDLIASARTLGCGCLVQRAAMNHHITRCGLLQPAEDVEQSGFACAGLAAEEHLFTGGDFDIDAA
jgi:hypothetical protein